MEESTSTIGIIFEGARFVSAGSLGVFSGAMLTEGGVLVPYWRSLPPSEFLAWYKVNGHRLQGFFGPLTTVTALLSLVAASVSLWEGHPARWLALFAAVISLSVVATFFLYFGKANASFASARLGVEKVPAELARWAKWHWWRTGLSLLALAVALLAVWRFR